MMENDSYEMLRDRSRGLFNNALVLPVALSIAEQVQVGSDLTIADIREWLGGRAASNQIREAVARIESTTAIGEMPYPGRPHPRRWQRNDHPLWSFVINWTTVRAAR